MFVLQTRTPLQPRERRGRGTWTTTVMMMMTERCGPSLLYQRLTSDPVLPKPRPLQLLRFWCSWPSRTKPGSEAWTWTWTCPPAAANIPFRLCGRTSAPTADWSLPFLSQPRPHRPAPRGRARSGLTSLSLFPSELFKEIFFQRRLCLYGCLGNAIFVFLLRFQSHFFFPSVSQK